MQQLITRFSGLLIFLTLFMTMSCGKGAEGSSERQESLAGQTAQQDETPRFKKRHIRSSDKYRANSKKAQNSPENRVEGSNRKVKGIPQKALDVLAYVREHGRAPEGYVGGRRFGNFEQHLPRQSTDGGRIDYREWDVNPRQRGRNRGTERLVTSSDGRAWYTNDHYNSFTEIK
jgi:ribonuclease T1